ncbi:MAG TPA: response regulator [Solirubrobacteraceae bacterium]|jgi:DNA-binding response OmpR family regulator|nr:response regulator [Solirubrobacteraceae bacterium]
MTAAGPLSRGDEPAPVVVLEDDRTTAALIAQILAATNMVNPLEHFSTAREAIGYLERAPEAGMTPVLLVLDLSLPDASGLDVLRWVHARPELVGVPVVMLSGSGDDEDIERAYEIGIDAYLVKPAGIHGLPDVVRGLGLPYVLRARSV